MAEHTRQEEEWHAFLPPGAEAPAGSLPFASDLPPAKSSVALSNSARRPFRLAEALAHERDRGTGFVFLPVWMAIGVLGYGTWPTEPPFGWLLLSTALALVGLVATSRFHWLRGVLLVLIAIMAGATFAALETRRAGTQVSGSEIGTTITGHVVRIEHQATGRTRLTIDVFATERPELRYAPDRVRLSAREVPDGLEVGDVVRGAARLMPPSGPVRPGGYDFSYNNYYDGIGAIGFFFRTPELSQSPMPLSLRQSFTLQAERIRDAIAARIRAHIEGPSAEIAAALIAGVRAGIPETINEDLRKTGLAHILSISGLHMVLVAGTVLFAIRSTFALFPMFASRLPAKKYAAIVALVVTALYLAISGGAVAAQRSFIMLAVMLVAVLFDRVALTMRNLAISALIVIAISPHEVFGPSFQMSFAATAALIGAYAAWSERKRREGEHIAPRNWTFRLGLIGLKFIVGLALTSIVAGLATTLYGVFHFHRVSPHSLWVNLIAMPIVSFVVMPFAVVATVAMPFALEGPLLKIMGIGIDMVIVIAAWFAARSPIDAVGAIPLGAVLLLTVALIVMTACSGRLRLAALPLVIIGAGLMSDRQFPDALVSEDGRLVAVPAEAGVLSVNRSRPNGFTIQNWLHGMNAERYVPPTKAATVADALAAATPGQDFICAEDVCLARDSAERLVVHVPDALSASRFCQAAALIVIDDATAQRPCGDEQAATLTKRDLARRGSAEVHFGEHSEAPLIIHAINEPYRPWHRHRQYSREARGMPPWSRD